ncbi:MAG: hypothetical protein MJ109_02820 [Kiritimatiellae bacterium]|nr:hypothetical protein [Kiritimatiellia bacterium]
MDNLKALNYCVGNVFLTGDSLLVKDDVETKELKWKHNLKYSEIRWVEEDCYSLSQFIGSLFLSAVGLFALCTLVGMYKNYSVSEIISCLQYFKWDHRWFCYVLLVEWHFFALGGIVGPIELIRGFRYRKLKIILNDGTCLEEEIPAKGYALIRQTLISKIIPQAQSADRGDSV